MCVVCQGWSILRLKKKYTIGSVEKELEGKTNEYGYNSTQKVIQIFKMKNALLDNGDSDKV